MDQRFRTFNVRYFALGLTAASFLIVGPLHSAAGPDNTAKPPASTLPDGHGKDLVLKDCQSCHSLQNVTSHRGNADDWAQVVSQMIGRGASISDDDADTIIDYLSAHFGPSSPKPVGPSSPSEQNSASNAAQPSNTPNESGGPNSTVNVNQASAEQLQSDLGLPADQVEAIVHYREKSGDFKNLQQLLAVPGVNAAKLKDEQNKITF